MGKLTNSATLADALEWWDSLTTDEEIEQEKKHGIYGHDQGTTLDEIFEMYQNNLKQTNTTMKKKEQFSIALWDRLKKDNIPHTFETRDGSEVTQITKFEGNLSHPIAGIYESVETWRENGFYAKKVESDLDLFIVWEEEQLMLEGWLNVYGYNKGLFIIHETKEIADSKAMNGRIACVKISIPYTKGEGLNDG